MPFICLARTDIPDGSVQILDLKPNSSQPQPRTAQGQTKYVNRTIRGDALTVSGSSAISPAAAGYKSNTSNTVTTTEDISGLTAYILDAVHPCNNASSTARIRLLNNLTAGPPANTITFTTAAGAFTITAGTDFAIGGSAALTATNIANYLNSGPGQASMTAPGSIGFVFAAAAIGVNVDITTNALTGEGAAGTIGLTTNSAVNIAFLFGGSTNNATYVTTRTRRTAEAWNVNLINRVTTNIQAAVDSGASLTTTALNTLCSPTVGTTGVTAANPAVFTTASAHGLTTGDSVWITGCAGAPAANVNGKNWIATVVSATTFSIDFDNSVAGLTAAAGVVNYAVNTSFTAGEAQLLGLMDLLKILSGTGYKLPSGTTLYSPVSIGGGQFTQDFHAALAGSFVEDVTGVTPAGGGYWQTDANPIPVILPIHPSRPTYSGAAFNMSISQGVLQQLAAGPTWNFNTRSFMNGDSGSSGRALTLAGTPIRSYAYQGNRANLKAGFASANPGGLTSLSGLRIVTVYDDAGNVLV